MAATIEVMDTMVASPQKGAEAKEPMDLTVLIVFQDASCGFRAKAALDRVLARLPRDGACSLDLWRFDLFDNARHRKQAARLAARADIILLSLHGDQPFPVSVRDWLGLWLNASHRPRQAFGILMDAAQRETREALETALCAYRAAQRDGVDLLLGFAEAPAARSVSMPEALPQWPPGGFPLPVEAVRRLEQFQPEAIL